MTNDNFKEKNESLKTRNLDIINCVRKHLQKPLKYRDLYFIPKYERAMILFSIDKLEKAYSNENEVESLNKDFYEKLMSIQKSNNETNVVDDYLVFLNEFTKKYFMVSYAFESKNGTIPVEESAYVFRGTKKECLSFMKGNVENDIV